MTGVKRKLPKAIYLLDIKIGDAHLSHSLIPGQKVGRVGIKTFCRMYLSVIVALNV